MSEATRSLSDWFSSLGARRAPGPIAAPASAETEPSHPSKALPKFLKLLQSNDSPVLLDLGPVVGSNVSFFGERLACRLRVEDIPADIDRHTKEGRVAALAEFFARRFTIPAESIDGILCWDILDFLDRPAAQALASALTRLLKADGALLGFFGTADQGAPVYTKYVIVDESTVKYRTYPGLQTRQRSLLNRDIIKLFEGLRVSDSFLMKNNVREILFRKPAYLAGR